MLLSEAKTILKKNGYILIKENGPSPDDYDNSKFVADMIIKFNGELYRIISFKAGTVKLETITESEDMPIEETITLPVEEIENAEILEDPRWSEDVDDPYYNDSIYGYKANI